MVVQLHAAGGETLSRLREAIRYGQGSSNLAPAATNGAPALRAQAIRNPMTKCRTSGFAAAPFFLFALLVSVSSAGAQGRIRPPDSITCDHNHLTSFTGKLLGYKRGPGRVSLRMRTDEATTESFTLRFRKAQDASRWFLMNGEAFKPDDWKLIERGKYRLRPKMRATVWVCDDGSIPIVDWRPGE